MLQTTSSTTITSATDAAMTPGEALAILHRLNEIVGHHLYRAEASEEEQVLRKQVLAAFRVLRITVHGKAPLECMQTLCDVCSLRYTPIANPLVRIIGDHRASKALCTPCLEQLKAEGKLAEIIDWKTGEVTPC